jgi:hypothetical protein
MQSITNIKLTTKKQIIMKTKLLFTSLLMVVLTSISSAQTKTWDFGNNTATWPLTASGVGTIGSGTQSIIDNLGLFSNDPANSAIVNFGAVNASSASFSDGYTAVNRFQMNGGGNTTSTGFLPMPTQRYLFFDVSGACTVNVWFKTGSAGTVRNVYVTNGTSTVGSAASNSGGNADLVILTANYTGAAGRLYIYCGPNEACNLFKITVTGATVNTVLANDTFEKSLTNNVFSNGKKVFVSNVTSDTQVNVYTMTGSLVKSFTTNSDTNFELNQGFYIVNVKSEEGEKSTKIVVE